MKKLISFVLALAASVGTVFAESGTCGYNLTWDLSNGVLTISGSGIMDDYKYMTPPWFSQQYSIKEVSIGNDVTRIGYSAFCDCSNLISVTIGNSVTFIGGHAFANCSSLTSVTIPNSVTFIEYCAFKNCTDLTSVTIGNSDTYIDEDVFSRCSINTIHFTGDIEQWCTKSWNPSDVSGGYALYIGDGLISDLVIPNSVTSIGESAFKGCYSLTSITIPNSVTSIGKLAFSGCSGLTSVTIPNSVTSIGQEAFYNCTGLTSVTIPNSITSIDAYVFYGCSGLTSVTIPNSVTSIGWYAFYSCTGLTSVTIPNSVTRINPYSFCNVANIIYSGSATGSPWGARSVNGYVDGYLVYSDASKTSLLACFSTAEGEVVIPNSVTRIEGKAFYGCSGLTSVSIPNSVTSIGDDAFYGCSGLTSVIWNAKNCSDFTSTNTPFYYYKDNNANIFDIRKQISSFTFGDDVERIPSYLCSGMINLNSINIPYSVTSIGWYAFSGCSGLTSVTIPNSVTSIGHYAFSGCTGFTSVTIPNSVTSIGLYAFYSCTGLTSVTIGNSVTSIGAYAFSGCTGLKFVTWNPKEGEIFNDSFGSQVESFVFGNEVEVIPARLCAGMNKLTSITIPNSVKTIKGSGGPSEKGAFSECTGLTQIINYGQIPANVYSAAFDGVDKFRCVLYVPKNSIDMYKNAAVWRDFYYIEPLENYTAINEIEVDANNSSNKYLHNGQVLILQDNKTYTITGQEIK